MLDTYLSTLKGPKAAKNDQGLLMASCYLIPEQLYYMFGIKGRLSRPFRPADHRESIMLVTFRRTYLKIIRIIYDFSEWLHVSPGLLCGQRHYCQQTLAKLDTLSSNMTQCRAFDAQICVV